MNDKWGETPERLHATINVWGTRGRVNAHAFEGSSEYIRADLVKKEDILLRQMDELLKDISFRDLRIAELEAERDDYKMSVSNLSTLYLGYLQQITELKSEVEGLTHERDRAIAWLASVGIGLSFEVAPAQYDAKDNGDGTYTHTFSFDDTKNE